MAAEQGFCLWFTGLSGSGKTTITNHLVKELRKRGSKLEVLDGDIVRENLSKGLGFSKEDRDTNIRRIAFVADLLSPQRRARDHRGDLALPRDPRRGAHEDGRPVHRGLRRRRSLEVCEERDVKGLYAKARSGEIKEFTGRLRPVRGPREPRAP